MAASRGTLNSMKSSLCRVGCAVAGRRAQLELGAARDDDPRRDEGVGGCPLHRFSLMIDTLTRPRAAPQAVLGVSQVLSFLAQSQPWLLLGTRPSIWAGSTWAMSGASSRPHWSPSPRRQRRRYGSGSAAVVRGCLVGYPQPESSSPHLSLPLSFPRPVSLPSSRSQPNGRRGKSSLWGTPTARWHATLSIRSWAWRSCGACV